MYRCFWILAFLSFSTPLSALDLTHVNPVRLDPGAAPNESLMTPAQKAVAEKLTSIWDYDTPDLPYGVSRNLDDGRGYTSGRAGFSTGAGDALRGVRCFDAQREENHLRKYLAELEFLEAEQGQAAEGASDVTGLDRLGQYPLDWALTDQNPSTQAVFRDCQDAVADELYYFPAMRLASRYGMSLALSKAVFYDTFISDGEVGAIAVAEFTQNMTGGTPAAGHNLNTEIRWLEIFLAKRKSVLNTNPLRQQASGRVVNYEHLLRDRNLDLAKGFNTLKTVSGYTIYHIDP